MLRRMTGIASVWNITSFANLKQRAFVLAINIGKRSGMELNTISTIENFNIVKEEAGGR